MCQSDDVRGAIHEKLGVDGVACRVAMPFHMCEKRHWYV